MYNFFWGLLFNKPISFNLFWDLLFNKPINELHTKTKYIFFNFKGEGRGKIYTFSGGISPKKGQKNTGLCSICFIEFTFCYILIISVKKQIEDDINKAKKESKKCGQFMSQEALPVGGADFGEIFGNCDKVSEW